MTLKNTLAMACFCFLISAAPSHAEESALSLSLASTMQNTPLSKRAATGVMETGDGLPVRELTAPAGLPKGIDLTTPSDDVLERIRNGFAMPNLNNDLVLYHQTWYMNRPDYLRRMVERSRRYMYHIVVELEKRGLPTELALLPMVESAYNPMALSRSNAMGLWQFIPATGKNYKLTQNWWYDQRRDIVASTSAALDYLQSIYEMHGDWFLALASYNWGEGAVGRAIAKNKARGLPTTYEDLTMPNETRNYVPKLQALKNILSSPRLMAQLELPAIPNRPYFSTIAKPADMDVKVAAKLAETPLDEFVALNPAHNRPVIKGESTLIVPADKVETFMANLESHQNKDRPLTSWRAYTLKRGEKLDQVAQRFGTTGAQLRSINGLSPKTRAGAGTTVLVPATGNDSNMPATLPDAPQVVIEAEPIRIHVVKKGDTLASIAKRNRVSVADLKRWNKLTKPQQAPGTRLLLAAPPSPGKTVAATSEAPPAKAAANTKVAEKSNEKGHDKAGSKSAPPAKNGTKSKSQAAPSSTQYVVKRGDTLISIAHHFKVDAVNIKRTNRLSSNALKPGQTLTIQLAKND
jgi:membrane-bound lytic murein transglycosylase D